LGVYFSYVPRLVDFMANSDVESLVLSSFVDHLDTEGFNERGLVGLAFEGLDF